MLKLYNTLTRKLEAFKPIKAGNAGMYTCGPTVYNYAHIGNFRAYIFEDLLKRYLKYKGYKVKQVMNRTDVDDKTIKGSQEQGMPLNEFTARYKKAFEEDTAALNIDKAEINPEATAHIKEMVALIKQLLKKGYAYKSEDGSIYFNIKKFKSYGKLANIETKNLKAGARVKQDEYDKQGLADFALWKSWSKEDGSVFWETELGKGRPGWHIECSAMSMKYLGKTFDIHTGGIDNMFPHHENERAQSEAATGKKFVNYWLHCEHLMVDGKKMSKSLGNFYTLRDLLAKGHNPKAIRYALMSTHYRKPLNFTFEELEAANTAVKKLEELKLYLDNSDGRAKAGKTTAKAARDFEEAMDDNLNISAALAAVFNLATEARKLDLSRKEAAKAKKLLLKFDEVLGLNLKKVKELELDRDIEALVQQRENARKEKNWAEADRIRELLKSKGIALEDSAEGVRWRKA